MLPSPGRSGLGLRFTFFSRPPLGSLALRPGDSLTIPRMALSIGFISFVSSTNAIQDTGLLTLAPVGLTPTEQTSLRWTHSPRKTPSTLYSNDLRNLEVELKASGDFGGASLGGRESVGCVQASDLEEHRPRPRFTCAFRPLGVLLSRVWDKWQQVKHLMQPATVKRWHTTAFRLYWRWKSRGQSTNGVFIGLPRRLVTPLCILRGGPKSEIAPAAVSRTPAPIVSPVG